MQTPQDEEYPWADDNDNDAPLYHVEAERTGLSTNFTTVSEKTNNPHRRWCIIVVGRQGTAIAYLLAKKPRCKMASIRVSWTPVHHADVN